MPHRIPHCLPAFAALADDVQCSRSALAAALGVSRSTLHRWIAHDDAPRTARLAIFWLTRWGMSALDADAHNSATMHAAMARALRDELIKSQRQIARLRRAIDAAPGGAANRPFYRPEPVPLIESGSA